MSNLSKLTICEALSGYKQKTFSVSEVVSETISNAKKNKHLNVFITETFDSALSQAKNSDILYNKGESRGLEGALVAVKDLFCTNGVRTTSGSKMLENFVPTYNSTIVSKLNDAGAISIGKTNMDEFAMGSANITSYFGPVENPWKASDSDEILVPGGSSGGSSACVASFMSMAALGSDTGGSIRQPASFTGTVGIKPSYGRCSRYGMIAFSSSLDQGGILTRSCEDAALILEYIMGYDSKDSTSAQIAVPKIRSHLQDSAKGMKIGIPKDIMSYEGISEEIHNIWQNTANLLKDNGMEIVEIELPTAQYALATYYVIASAEASSNLSRYDGVRYGHRTEQKIASLDELYEITRSEGFGDEVKRRIMIGTHVLSSGFMDAYYLKAQKIRQKIWNDFTSAFAKCDSILIPSSPTPAFSINRQDNNPVTMYLNDVFTIPASLAGLPAISVPSGFSRNGLPLGMQLIGRNFDELTILKIANIIEKTLNLDLNPRGF
ncbi:MAG: Asp-tRNA(Asn)/Glu-tRNA(Gln) amidotransferase subunit GatA [Alphaproteobacteria bacterium]|nr:Asp-tRNA(Asn)/Glu-tRNA(Gln) amidotransferase subunit GatA [Alphaproteobacteria bacterium]